MKYIDAKKLIAKIERLKARAEAERVLNPKTILSEKNYLLIKDYDALLDFIASLQQEAEEERVKKAKETQETAIKYRDLVIQRLERKRVLPNFKGQRLHDFKNELNTMEQILGIKNWSDIQYALFEKFAVVFATWGGYHFHPKYVESEDSLQNEQPEVDLEKEYQTWWNSISGKINVEHIMEWYMHETARHFYELGLNARKEE